MVAQGIVPNRTVEFHWYSAEERGLLGSRDIAKSYRQAEVNVIAMINYDVVGYYVPGNDDVAIITDYVDDELTQFLRILVDGYLDFGRRERGIYMYMYIFIDYRLLMNKQLDYYNIIVHCIF